MYKFGEEISQENDKQNKDLIATLKSKRIFTKKSITRNTDSHYMIKFTRQM